MHTDTFFSQSDRPQIGLAERKLSLLLKIADEVLSLFQVSLTQLNNAIKQQAIPMTWRKQVLIGL